MEFLISDHCEGWAVQYVPNSSMQCADMADDSIDQSKDTQRLRTLYYILSWTKVEL